MNNELSEKVAKIDNTFILNAQYRMTAKEQKLLYYLISHLDPKNEKGFNIIRIPIRQIEETLKESVKKWGSLYEEIDRLCGNMISKNITFTSKVIIDGKPLKGRINFFSAIRPIVDDNGQTLIEFEFSNNMRPFLLQLHHYVNIGVLEVVPMKNAHAIRMYSIFKSERDRMRGVVNNITMTYSLEELKTILGIDDKYTGGSFQNFKVNVLDRIIDEINENCPTMFVKYSYLKTHRKVTGIVFSVYERKESPELLEQTPPIKENKAKTDVKTYTPSEQELGALTRAKGQAFRILVNFGIFPGIAYKQIIPKIKGSEFDGYEDFFVEKAILHFEKNAIQKTTKELKASTFVTWWTKNKVFESGDVWADILEKLSKHKKQLQTTNPAAFENRLIAKTMTNAEFEVYINKMR
jgi:Initiator Replication protein